MATCGCPGFAHEKNPREKERKKKELNKIEADKELESRSCFMVISVETVSQELGDRVRADQGCACPAWRAGCAIARASPSTDVGQRCASAQLPGAQGMVTAAPSFPQ